jgi:hypothetical protein
MSHSNYKLCPCPHKLLKNVTVFIKLTKKIKMTIIFFFNKIKMSLQIKKKTKNNFKKIIYIYIYIF